MFCASAGKENETTIAARKNVLGARVIKALLEGNRRQAKPCIQFMPMTYCVFLVRIAAWFVTSLSLRLQAGTFSSVWGSRMKSDGDMARSGTGADYGIRSHDYGEVTRWIRASTARSIA